MGIMDISIVKAFAVWRREITVYRKIFLQGLVPNFFEPIILLAGMGYGVGGLVKEVDGLPYLSFIAPGLLAVAAMEGALYEATWNFFVRLHINRIYDAIVTTPCSPDDVVLGELMWSVTRSLLYGIAFFIVLVIMGELRDPLALLFPIPVALTGFMFACIGVTFSGFISKIDFYSYFWTLFVTPMIFLSGIFFPVSAMPEFMQEIVWFTPLYHSVEAMRGILGYSEPDEVIGHFLWLTVVSAVTFVSAVLLVRKRLVT